jgi:hypothetical protein
VTGDSEDREFENYLAGKSPVSQRYAEMGDEQPPADLTATILAAAERSIKVRPWPYGSMARRWMKPMAFAATILIALSVVMNIVMQPAEVLDLERVLTESDADRKSSVPASSRVQSLGDLASEPVAESADAFSGEVDEQRAPSRMEFAVQSPLPDLESVINEIRRQLDVSLAGGVAMSIGDAAMAEERVVTASKTPKGQGKTNRELASGSAKSELKAKEEISPDASLSHILELYEDHQNDLAWRNIGEFRKNFPDHPFTLWLENEGY